MGGSLGRGLLTAAALWSGAVPGAAQEAGRRCRVMLDSVGGIGVQREIRPGAWHTFGNGGVWAHCQGESTAMRSDSVAWYEDISRVDLVGRVHFQDSTVRLEANRASYFLRDERLEAYGQVSLTNRRSGTRLTGPNLTYYRRAGVRDTAELYGTGRPLVEYRSEGDTAGAEPYRIRGEKVRLRGHSHGWAAGAVTIDRSDLAARADSAALDLAGGLGHLVGHAEVRGGRDSSYVLTGRSIRYRLTNRRLTWVQSRELAEAVSRDWRLTADTIEFDVAAQRIQSGRAWSDTTRARALSTTYSIRADSLALDTPDQRLREVRGFGHGLASARTDSTRMDGDWMAGDTVTARFDSTLAGPALLSRITARGNARALYHVPDPERPGGPPGISYARGSQVAARFTPLGLDRVDVVGDGDGVYLEPVAPAPPAPLPPMQPGSRPPPRGAP